MISCFRCKYSQTDRRWPYKRPESDGRQDGNGSRGPATSLGHHQGSAASGQSGRQTAPHSQGEGIVYRIIIFNTSQIYHPYWALFVSFIPLFANSYIQCLFQVLFSLSGLEDVSSFPEFVNGFSQFGKDMVELAHLSGDRQNVSSDDICHQYKWLKLAPPIGPVCLQSGSENTDVRLMSTSLINVYLLWYLTPIFPKWLKLACLQGESENTDLGLMSTSLIKTSFICKDIWHQYSQCD